MDTINCLEQLIRMDSINPFQTVRTDNGKVIGVGNRNYGLAQFIESSLRASGFDVRRQVIEEQRTVTLEDGSSFSVPNRYNILAEKGDGKDSLLLFGHMDTVEVKQGWDKETALTPLRKQIHDPEYGDLEAMYGLGAVDMKAGLAVMLAAANSFSAKGHKLKLAFLDDEEFWSFGANQLIQDRKFVSDITAALVPEVGDVENHNGAKTIILGRMGRAEYEFIIPGKSDHGANVRARLGHNAVDDLGEIILRLRRYCSECAAGFRYDDSGARIQNAAFVNMAQGGKRTLSIPERAVLYLDRSFIPDEDKDAELDRLRKVIDAMYSAGKLVPVIVSGKEQRVTVNLAYRPTEPSEPFLTPIGNSFTRYTAVTIGDLFKCQPNYAFGKSVADENIIANRLNIPVLVIGPIGRQCHCANEWVGVQSVRELADAYQSLVNNFGDYLKVK